MVTADPKAIIQSYVSFLADKDFPCLAARGALNKNMLSCMVAGHMACPADDARILDFLYGFIDQSKHSEQGYHSATVIFSAPIQVDEYLFENMIWQRLQALSDIDATRYGYDPRVSQDPASPMFSFSLKQEALYVIGMHPGSSRKARRFHYPALVFNPHQQFEILRKKGQYEKMQEAVRKRDMAYSGSINPMLADFGSISEAIQYSGRQYDNSWQCPFKSKHGKI
jgi:uncharacterized protein